eukprot:CAMPEP_0172395756 /NCGR_PEP_ID=MMETSP1061-20121228/21654_1 /TAXON_ID=37318 /ORGANISM="Pseudo-nitzschia pungens, Strain cf. pungens" /LENGTH=627 /DNA_ID=CAMNT_0013127453 /DNA_START=64 /DNA_END=1947 /DNA_ORIENTATION=-
MSAWGKTGSARSCDALLKRIEDNDPRLTELVVLPLKDFGSKEVRRLARCIAKGSNTHLRSLQASGHAIDDLSALEELGRALAGEGAGAGEGCGSGSGSGSGSALETIAIGDSNLGDDGVMALCRGLNATKTATTGSSNHKLRGIDLSYKNIGQEGCLELFRTLAGSTSLRSIDLSRNESIGPDFDFANAATTFASMSMSASASASAETRRLLPAFPSLTHMDLSECSLNARSCHSLVTAVVGTSDNRSNSNSNSETEIEIEIETGIAHRMEEEEEPLIIKLGGNDLSGDLDSVGAMARALASVSASSIASTNTVVVSELHLAHCKLGDDGLERMVNEFRSGFESSGSSPPHRSRFPLPLRFLDTLDLSNNGLTSLGPLARANNDANENATENATENANTNANACSYLSKLVSLNVSGNPLGPGLESTIDAEASAASWISSLRELDLSHSSCSAGGACAILRSCDTPGSCLQTLNLFGNNLGTEGFLALTKVLRGGHSSLEYLDLGGNGVSEAGVVALVETILDEPPAGSMLESDAGTETNAETKADEEEAHARPEQRSNRPNNALRVLVVGGNTGGPALEAVVERAKTLLPDLDIARDKPKQKQGNDNNGMHHQNPIHSMPGTSWMA